MQQRRRKRFSGKLWSSIGCSALIRNHFSSSSPSTAKSWPLNQCVFLFFIIIIIAMFRFCSSPRVMGMQLVKGAASLYSCHLQATGNISHRWSRLSGWQHSPVSPHLPISDGEAPSRQRALVFSPLLSCGF